MAPSRATTEAVQICGGMGYTKRKAVEKIMRGAKVIQICEGAGQIMRRLLARRATGKTGPKEAEKRKSDFVVAQGFVVAHLPCKTGIAGAW